MSDPKAIANAFSKYYEQLYDAKTSPNKSEKNKQFLQQINLTKLNQKEAKAIVETITEEEIKTAIDKLKNNKSLGPDGFPGEFCKCFQAELIPLLHKAYNYALNARDPPRTWAAQLRGAVEWLKQNNETTWPSLEQNSCLGVSLQVLPFCSNEIWTRNNITNIWMKCTRKVLN